MKDQKKNSILIFLPTKDFNETEYLTVKNYFVNKGKKVFITSDDHTFCCGNKGLKVKSDVSFFNINDKNFDGLILIGGSGSRSYKTNPTLKKIAIHFDESRKTIGAICSAPLILASARLLKQATCSSEDKNDLIDSGVDYKDLPMVVDRNFITADGPNSAGRFAETIFHSIYKI
jgi:putative intracellular protease/amidase